MEGLNKVSKVEDIETACASYLAAKEYSKKWTKKLTALVVEDFRRTSKVYQWLPRWMYDPTDGEILYKMTGVLTETWFENRTATALFAYFSKKGLFIEEVTQLVDIQKLDNSTPYLAFNGCRTLVAEQGEIYLTPQQVQFVTLWKNFKFNTNVEGAWL